MSLVLLDGGQGDGGGGPGQRQQREAGLPVGPVAELLVAVADGHLAVPAVEAAVLRRVDGGVTVRVEADDRLVAGVGGEAGALWVGGGGGGGGGPDNNDFEGMLLSFATYNSNVKIPNSSKTPVCIAVKGKLLIQLMTGSFCLLGQVYFFPSLLQLTEVDLLAPG